MVWVPDLNWRKLRNEILKFSPLKTWICSSTRQAWDAEGSRISRRVDVAKVKKELMGSQIWSVVRWRFDGFVGLGGINGVDGSGSGCLGDSRIRVTDLNRRKLSNEMLSFPPLESWLGHSTLQTWVDDGSWSSRRVDVVKMKKELMGSVCWFVVLIRAWMASLVVGGDEWWRRWMGFNGWRRWWLRMVASMVGVDGELGSSTQMGTDVEVPLCHQW